MVFSSPYLLPPSLCHRVRLSDHKVPALNSLFAIFKRSPFSRTQFCASTQFRSYSSLQRWPTDLTGADLSLACLGCQGLCCCQVSRKTRKTSIFTCKRSNERFPGRQRAHVRMRIARLVAECPASPLNPNSSLHDLDWCWSFFWEW
jgi:hypothetical protein